MNDKFALFYVKEDTLYPIAMSQDEFDMLQVVAPMCFQGKKINVINEPQGKVQNINKKTEEKINE